MGDKSCIYWFSGTGNSLYVAKLLSADLAGIPIAPITGAAPSDAVGGDGARIGFVFPSYFGNMPRAVRAFIEKTEIRPGTYVFAVVTMGGFGLGSLSALDAALMSKGSQLSYGKGIHMPANYVLKYNPADPEKCEKAIDKADRRLHGFAAEITAGMKYVEKLPIVAKNLYKGIESLDAAFAAGESCTGCGLCERICLVQNIRLEDSKPTWLHRCEHCVACISWCPEQAIEYGERTHGRRRYRNPRVTAEELAAASQRGAEGAANRVVEDADPYAKSE